MATRMTAGASTSSGAGQKSSAAAPTASPNRAEANPLKIHPHQSSGI
jgi:hypothetical protein